MTVHLRAIHSCDHDRADMRVASRLREEKTEQLRAEVEQEQPLLFWPIRKKEGVSMSGASLGDYAVKQAAE